MRWLLLTALLALAAATGAQAATTTVVVEGRGWGHGIGMSQYGAQGYALAGWDHRRILGHYYRGTRLERYPGRTVRILLLEDRARARIASTRAFRVRGPGGKVRRLPARALVLKAASLRGERLYTPGAAPLLVNGVAYRGRVRVHVAGGKLQVVNELPLELYLRGVVPGEMPDHWHAEALQAQAVVARTYALATLKPGLHYDLHADVRSQVYGGLPYEEDSTTRAIVATSGQVLTWNGRPAETYYHSTSGGRTANVEDVWPGADPLPYLVSVSDPHDRLSVHHRWTLSLTPRAIARRLGMRNVLDLRVERGRGGRVAAVDVVGPRAARRIDAGEFRRRLELRSTWFSVRILRLEQERAGKIVRLTGFVRGGGPVYLERRGDLEWERVRRVRVAPNGRFRTRVTPDRPTAYRLAVGEAAGAPVRVLTGR